MTNKITPTFQMILFVIAATAIVMLAFVLPALDTVMPPDCEEGTTKVFRSPDTSSDLWTCKEFSNE